MQKIKIVCLGDSITFGYNVVKGKQTQAPNNYPYHLEKKLEDYYEEVEVINSGKPGWQIKQANLYINDLVVNHRPDLCFIMYGINDMRGSIRGGFKISSDRFLAELHIIILKLQLKNIKVVLLTPICIEDERVSDLSKLIVEFGVKNEIPVIDINKLTRLAIAKSNENIKDVIADGVHLRDDWYYIISDIIINEYFRLANEK